MPYLSCRAVNKAVCAGCSQGKSCGLIRHGPASTGTLEHSRNLLMNSTAIALHLFYILYALFVVMLYVETSWSEVFLKKEFMSFNCKGTSSSAISKR